MFKHNYGAFPGTPETTPNPVSVGGNSSSSAFTDGNVMIFSPTYTLHFGANYHASISGDHESVDVSANYTYNDGFYFEPGNRVKQPTFGLLNGQVAWNLPGDRCRVRIWGKNLTDTHYLLMFSSSLNDSGAPAAPRTYGVAVDFKL
jgi:iron complex outermembrane receptor protein